MKRYIRASEETAWIVTFGQDGGNAESGPIIYSGEYLIYAISEDEACRKFEDEYAYDLDGYEGCWARRATQKEIDEWYSYMNEPEDLPFASSRSKKRSIKASQETYQLYQNKRNENKYIEVKKAKDGHTYYRQFMYWNTDRGPVKNYSGSKTNRGRYHRTRLDSLEQVLEDYVPVEGVHSEEDVFESTSIRASWPEELTYDDYPEGDQIIEGLIQAVDYLDIFEEPSTQGGVGSDFFFTSDGEELGSIDIQEEEEILRDLYHSSKSKEDYHKKVKIWLANFLNL